MDYLLSHWDCLQAISTKMLNVNHHNNFSTSTFERSVSESKNAADCWSLVIFENGVYEFRRSLQRSVQSSAIIQQRKN